jgi:uncharacterized protein (DUF111 family)
MPLEDEMIMEMNVQVALIETIGLILASLIPTIVAGIYASKFLAKKRLQKELLTSLQDLEFMNEVEKILLDNSTLSKIEVRKKVSESLSRDRSINAENARIKKRIDSLQDKIEESNNVVLMD